MIPTSSLRGFEKLYGRVRKKLPMERGEVKGRQLNEDHVRAVAKILRKVGCIFEVVTVDMGLHSEEGIRLHRDEQAEKFTANLTPQHQPKVIEQVKELRKQLEGLPSQLYVQSVAMRALLYNTMFHTNVFFAFRRPRELGEYHWIMDAKGASKITPWEEWWLQIILPLLESQSLREPFVYVEGGDYRYAKRFEVEPGEHILPYAKEPEKAAFDDLRLKLTEDFRFSPDSEFGLEAVDILTNTVRRSMAGNFQRPGWMSLPQLMIHDDQHYIKMVNLEEPTAAADYPYMKVLNDFRKGGRLLIPDGVK